MINNSTVLEESLNDLAFPILSLSGLSREGEAPKTFHDRTDWCCCLCEKNLTRIEGQNIPQQFHRQLWKRQLFVWCSTQWCQWIHELTERIQHAKQPMIEEKYEETFRIRCPQLKPCPKQLSQRIDHCIVEAFHLQKTKHSSHESRCNSRLHLIVGASPWLAKHSKSINWRDPASLEFIIRCLCQDLGKA